MSRSTLLWSIALAAAAVVIPFYLDASWLQDGLFAMAAAIGAIGLNLLTGATGQLSMGHAFFLAVGAFGYVYFASLGGGRPLPRRPGPAHPGGGRPGGAPGGRRGRAVQPHRRPAEGRLPRHRHPGADLHRPVRDVQRHAGDRRPQRPVPPLEVFGFVFADTPDAPW
ncbi:hypothetical protein [Planobispora longispora]|uniref:hypothetical protein n=1 Tax=Planobispora longispora TaxID=28887 RepID=UPI0036185B09|nr:hypothetical protein GCM10020093_000370 [Planobispora longispora]